MKDFVASDSLKEKLAAAETIEEVIKACAEEGIEITREQLEAAEASQNEELSADDLDNVTGGLSVVGTGVGIALYMLWRAVRKRR